VICEEAQDTLLAAWEEDIVEQRIRETAVSAAFLSIY